MTAKIVVGVALGGIIAIAVAPVGWTVPIVAAGTAAMMMAGAGRKAR